MIHILKSIGIVSIVLICNLALLYVGVNEVFLMHGWGVACWVVFMDAVQVAQDLKVTQELLKSTKEKLHWLQDMYQREIHMSQIKHIEFISSFSSHASSVENGLKSLSDEISHLSSSSYSSPQSISSNSKVTVPKIQADFDITKRKQALQKKSISLDTKTYTLVARARTSPPPTAIRALIGTGSCEF